MIFLLQAVTQKPGTNNLKGRPSLQNELNFSGPTWTSQNWSIPQVAPPLAGSFRIFYVNDNMSPVTADTSFSVVFL